MTFKSYYDKYARHMIDTEFYAQMWEDRTHLMLSRLRKRMRDVLDSYGVISSKAKYNLLMRDIESEVDDEVDGFAEKLDKEEEDQREKEVDWLEKLMKAALGITVVMALLNMRKLKSQPFGKYEDLKDFTTTLKEKIKKTVSVPSLSSYMFGSGLSTVEEEMDRSFDTIEKDVMKDVHLSVTENQRNTQRLLLEDNSGLEYIYVSMLDSSTCPVCGSYSGNRYKDLSKAPIIPVHYACRCYYLPVRKGQKYNEQSYRDWFEEQADSVKYKILGPARYGFYKSGMKFSEFTSNGRKLTLKELFEE